MSSLKKQFISAVLYTGSAKYASLLVQLVITGILSRLLTPNDFGIVAIANVFILFFSLLSDAGLGVAVIQNKTLDKADIQNIFSLSIYLGIGLAAAFYMLSDKIAAFYKRPILEPVCHLLSINILFASFNGVLNALLLREKLFRFIAIRTLVIQVLSGLAGIAAAYFGYGVYALIVYAIASSGLLFALNYWRNPLSISIRISLHSIKKIYKYSVYQFLFNFINFFSRNLDKILIGKFLSPSTLGYYDKAYRLMLLPVENLAQVLAPVIHPLFSDFQQDKQRIFQSYIKIVKVLTLIGFPLSVFLHFAAEELVYIIFGTQWHEAVPAFKILAWSVGVQLVLSSTGAIFQAANNTRLLFIIGFISAIIMIAGISYGVFIAQSLRGVAYGLLVAFPVNFVMSSILLIRMLNGSFYQFIHLFKSPLVLASLVFWAEYVFSSVTYINGLFLSLAVKSLLMLLAVVAGLIWTGDYAPIMSFIRSKAK